MTIAVWGPFTPESRPFVSHEMVTCPRKPDIVESMPHDPSDRPVPTVVPDSDATVTEAAPLFVAVAAEDDILDTALCTLVEAWGHRAGILRPDADHSRSGRPADESGTVIASARRVD